MVGRSRVAVVLAVILVCLGTLAACGDDGDGNGNGNGGGSQATSSEDGNAASEAQQVYIDVGCAECHGENGEGNGTDPNTNLRDAQVVIIEQQFRTFVRNGRGSAMPAHTEEQISDEQIKLIYEWLYKS